MKKILYFLLAIVVGVWVYIGGVNRFQTNAAGDLCNRYGDASSDGYKACVKCKNTVTDTSCMQQYSCDSLFVDSTEASQCNYKRCMETRDSAKYCNCKYGLGGDGKTGKGIALNTDLPFVGRCFGASSGTAGDTAALTAFPQILSVASRILVTVILLASFIMIIVGGAQWAGGNIKGGKDMIRRVVIGLALLGMMGAILRLINPNFFT